MRFEMRLKIKIETALSVGAGASKPAIGVDKGMARDARGRVIIPGSSIKGKLRFECERILRGLNPLLVCEPPRPETMCPQYALPGEADKLVPQRRLCAVCRLFGSPWFKGSLLFSDAKLMDGEAWKGLDSQIRPGVSISRRRRVAEDEKLFFIETSLPQTGMIFEETIRGEISDEKEVALILGGLRCLCAIGGGKSRGLGWSSIEISKIILDGIERETEGFVDKIGEWEE